MIILVGEYGSIYRNPLGVKLTSPIVVASNREQVLLLISENEDTTHQTYWNTRHSRPKEPDMERCGRQQRERAPLLCGFGVA